MAWGFFKKIRDGVKKAAKWLKDAIPKAKTLLDQSKPLIKNLIDNDEGKLKRFDAFADGLNAANEVVTKNDFNSAIDWTKTNIAPRLKFH